MAAKPKTDRIQALKAQGFEILYLSHAKSILNGEFPAAMAELASVLASIDLPISEIIGSGGGETKFTQRLRKALTGLGWKKHNFVIQKIVDGVPKESTSHEVDHVKSIDGVGTIGCEIEWNNKDPFFDRDLENFKRLHAEGAISAGIVITRGKSLQDQLHNLVATYAADNKITDWKSLAAVGVVPTPKQIANIDARVKRKKDPLPFSEAWVANFVYSKFGAATTHWAKLEHRVERGVGNPCPLLLIGLPASIVVIDKAKVEQLSEDEVSTDPVTAESEAAAAAAAAAPTPL